MRFTDQLLSHFAHPRGALGALAGVLMAHRRDNIARGQWAVDMLAPARDARVLELGCGPGVALAGMCRLVPDGQVIGVDCSPVMLRQAARRTERFVASGLLELRLGDAAELGPDLDGFDLIYGINVWHCWADSAAVVAGLATRLRPGGRLGLIYMRPPGAALTHGEAARSLAADFAVTSLIHPGTEWMPHEPPAVLVSGRHPSR
ncbi:class I SAM-dependent methyltransferase [Nocardia thraciensis]